MIYQPDIGICASYAPFNCLLPGALITVDTALISDIFTSEKINLSRSPIVHYFLEKASDSKQTHEDASPGRMQEFFEDEKMPYQKIIKAEQDYNELTSMTMIPIFFEHKQAQIGHADPVIKLNMITNLVSLFFRLQTPKTVMTSILSFVNNEHWLYFTWMAKKGLFQGCFSKDSQKQVNYNANSIFRIIKKLLNDSEYLKNQTHKVLFESYKEFLFLNHDNVIISPLHFRQIIALTQCWRTLAEHTEFQHLIIPSYFKKVQSISTASFWHADINSYHLKKCQQQVVEISGRLDIH